MNEGEDYTAGAERKICKKRQHLIEKKKKKMGGSRESDDDGENEIRWCLPKLGTIVVNA